MIPCLSKESSNTEYFQGLILDQLPPCVYTVLTEHETMDRKPLMLRGPLSFYDNDDDYANYQRVRLLNTHLHVILLWRF